MRPEDRAPAALAHAFAAVPLWGIVGDTAIWLYYKERSREVVFHAQQAIFFQVSVLALALAGILVAIFGRILSVISEGLSEFILGANTRLIILGLILYAGVCLFGAFRTWTQGRFLYPVIGPRMLEGLRHHSREE